MMKALQLGHSNTKIAMTCIIMLEQWFSELPPQITAKLYVQLLPMLSDYLSVETESRVDYYHQSVLLAETDFGQAKFSRKNISKRVLSLLGKLGGFAHNIISNEESKKRERENFIRWDTEK